MEKRKHVVVATRWTSPDAINDKSKTTNTETKINFTDEKMFLIIFELS